MIKFILTMFFLCTAITSYCQGGDAQIRLKVLKSHHIGKEYKFIHPDKSETYLKYLGAIRNNKGGTYKILNSIWIWGISHHATSRLLIYNIKNQYLAEYLMNMTYDLPDYVHGVNLVFLTSDDGDCDKKRVSYVNLSRGLPEEYWLGCRGSQGDSYFVYHDGRYLK